MTALVKHYTVEEFSKFYVSSRNINFFIHSIGIGGDDYQKFLEIEQGIGAYNMPRAVCVDVANGYSRDFLLFCEKFKRDNPAYQLIAGNVVTEARVHELALAGVDIVKVGIGPGSVCTTRKMTGVGYPQFSAVMKCAEAADIAGIRIIADGGCVVPGDIAKAFCAGADFVMLGGMLAGHTEGYKDEELNSEYNRAFASSGVRPSLPFHGMSSRKAQNNHGGSIKEYRASEGRELLIKYRGSVKNTILEILGGLRSTGSYIGAKSIDDFSARGKFIRVNRQLNNAFGDQT